MKRQKSFNNNTHLKRHTRRPAYGIATDYRIYHDDTPEPDIRRFGAPAFIVVSLMALLLGAKTVVKLGAILWRHYTAPRRADLFELLYARQLLRERYPQALAMAYLPQIVENHLPVAVYRVIDGAIIRRQRGFLTRAGETYTLTGAARLVPCRFTADEVMNLFAAPDWLGEQQIIITIQS